MKTQSLIRLMLTISSACLIASCAKKPGTEDLSSLNAISSGDIIVSNSGADSLMLFTSTGQFKKTLISLDNSAGLSLGGIVLNRDTNQILVNVSGSVKVLGVNRSTLEVSEFASHGQLTGLLKGITQLPMGDVLVVESTTIERFDKNGGRITSDVTSGAWPKALQTTGTEISARSDSGFILCSTNTDVVRTYGPDGVQISSVASGIAGTTDVASCVNGPNDSAVYAVFSGTTDTVRKLDATSLATTWSYSNLSILASPTGMAVRANGNVLILDSVFNHVVEIGSDGSAIGIVKGDINAMLSSPQFIYVVP